MKLLLVSEFFPDLKELKFSGGVEAREYFAARELAKRNQVTVITSALEKLPAREKIGKLEILRVGPKRPYRATAGNLKERIGFIRAAVKAGETVDVDLVEGSNFITHFIASQVARKRKIPAVAWYPDVWLGSWVKNAGLIGLTGELLERFNLWRGFDAFIAISKETAKKLRKHTKKEIAVIPCGVEPGEFKGQTKKFEVPTVVSVGRLVSYKNHQTTIEALGYLKDLKWKLIIIGSGGMKRKLIKLAGQNGIGSRVKFLENIPRERLITTLKSSYMFVLVSRVEGFGIAVIEAAAASIPLVVSNIDINKEVTKNGKGGFLVDPDKPKDVSDKIRVLLTDKGIYDQKAAECRMLAQKYRWDKMTVETEKLFRKII